MANEPPQAELAEAPLRDPWREFLDNRWLLLGTLFFATAALGIPFLWQSRAFSTGEKWGFTAVLLVYTAVLLWLFWLVMAWCYGRIAGALG